MKRYPEAGQAQLVVALGFIETANQHAADERTDDLLGFDLPDIYRSIYRLYQAMDMSERLEAEIATLQPRADASNPTQT